MSPFLYQPIFLAITGIASYATVLLYLSSPDYRFQERKGQIWLPLIMSVVFVFWLGSRPVSGAAFGDTVNYAFVYMMKSESIDFTMNINNEGMWSLLMNSCRSLGLSVHGFFIVVEAGYILSALWAVKRFVPNNPMLGMIFVWTSLMFFSFGTNGLRNGLACHIMLLAMSFFFDDKYVIGGLLCILAFGFHRSLMLPIAAMLVGRFVVKDFRYAVVFWFCSIALSLVAGNSMTNFFISLGFDDRMSTYITTEYDGLFSNTGFRWDFLIYSVFPMLMGWYVCVTKRIRDDWFRTLCVTYCLCNAFWVIVIRAAFSNRFAYLSWFMYPIIIVYPLVNLPVWEDQDRKTAIILALYCSFSLFMQFVVW